MVKKMVEVPTIYNQDEVALVVLHYAANVDNLWLKTDYGHDKLSLQMDMTA